MATLRLFANLREAAGTGTATIDGTTVGEVLDNATEAFGPEFAAGLGIANVWVNGNQADPATAVAPTDEIALIPPVSGGTTAELLEKEATPAVLVILLAITIGLANSDSVQALTFAAVGLGLAWVWDIRDTVNLGGSIIASIPSLIAVTAVGNATYHWSTTGFAAGLAITVGVVLTWSLFAARYRTIESMATEGATAIIGALGIGSLVMMRLDSESAVNAFLAIIVLSALATWAIERWFADVQGIDPNLSGAVGAIVAAIGVGVLSDALSTAVALVAAAAAVAGMFAGRSLLSLVRTGMVTHTMRTPGMLSALDGAVLGATGFWLGLRLFG